MESQQRDGMNSHQDRGIADRSNSWEDRFRFVVTIVVLFTAVFFTYESFLSSVCVDAQKQCLEEGRGSLSKLYFSDDNLQYAKLTREVFSESKGFEFMVWDHERTNLARNLLTAQHQRINLQPLNDELWLELNYLNSNARVDHSERSWALNRSEKIAGWNYEESAKIVHFCVNEYELYGQITTSSCVAKLVDLPGYWSLRQWATKANLNSERLARARSEALKTRIVEAP